MNSRSKPFSYGRRAAGALLRSNRIWVSVKAAHYLTGADWGAENQRHAHHYRIELQLEGERLDEHGFLVDIVAIERVLDEQVASYRDSALNEMPAFKGLNPSLEHFCRILCQAMIEHIHSDNIRAVTVKLWESDLAWASYRIDMGGV